MRVRKSALLPLLMALMGLALRPMLAQSVQPLIAEYVEHASGSFQVTNSSLVAMAVILEPKSFSINPDGTGVFRPLDKGIHLQLSTTSVRLEPRESATIFYKASADVAPAWMSVYSSFTRLVPTPGLNVKIMLPHTIYLYQKEGLSRDAIVVHSVEYDAVKHRIRCDLKNESAGAGRAESVEAKGDRASASDSGFPLLPFESRILSIAWDSPRPPKTLELEFARFTLKLEVTEMKALP